MSPILSCISLAGALALVGIASALPTAAVTDNALQQRDIQSPIAGLPGCGISDKGKPDNQDPTWAAGKSKYTDGEGHSIGVDCSGGHNSDHCWHEYFLVGTQVGYDGWYQAIGDINCGGNGSTCSQEVDKTTQSCKTTMWSVSESISAGFKGELFEIGADLTFTQGQEAQTCNSTTSASTCQWTDANCHSIWAAQRVTTAYGYVRRNCVGPTSDPDANMPNSPQRADGYYTRGMMDFAIPLADGNAIDCRGTCSSSYNPGPAPELPNGVGDFKPWPTS